DAVALGPLRHHLDARQAWADHSAGREPTEPPSELPAWRIVAPLPADELLGYYRAAQDAIGIPWQYLAAIHFQETRMGRIAGTSSAGAVGPMQFLPSTWAECCEGDPTVASDAIMGAAVYLADRGGVFDIESALYGYNPNSGYVGAVMAYARNMMDDERAYYGYHGWQVLFGTSAGTVRLPVGYDSTVPIRVEEYLADHPDDLVG
ncbi:MAG: lytic transglycosylase domain-containing protein, partial [Ilumatobacteraceae bacterium]